MRAPPCHPPASTRAQGQQAEAEGERSHAPAKRGVGKPAHRCRRREVRRGPADSLARELPGLLPEGFSGAVMCGGLAHRAEPIGAAVLEAAPGSAFTERDADLLELRLEPLAVALDNDHRLRELAALREARRRTAPACCAAWAGRTWRRPWWEPSPGCAT